MTCLVQLKAKAEPVFFFFIWWTSLVQHIYLLFFVVLSIVCDQLSSVLTFLSLIKAFDLLVAMKE